jgi:tetratricopeptide (TPR) repeat protein
LGTILAHTMRQEAALDAYERALRLNPAQIDVLLAKGRVLQTLGRRAQCEAAYKECIALRDDFGEAYYSLADLKNYRFDDAEIAAMEDLLREATAAPREGQAVAQLHFALGRAREQRGRYEEAFDQYSLGNALQRRRAVFDAAAFERKCRRVAALFDAAFFAARTGAGMPDPAPIFIVGMPRSGATLVEQVLASHSAVEGTMELPNLPGLVRELERLDGGGDAYPESVAAMSAGQFRALGARYIDETRIFRARSNFFIDKMPENFSHVGLIQLILPKAKIIDVRRHPMDTCFSAFKQFFAEGQSFTNDLEDLGRYYRSYVGLMDHWDSALPGRVLQVRYEDLVRDTETEVRRLLAHCGLEFEEACLRFYETRRAVGTASSEQVRVPMYDSSIGYWRLFEPQLEPLRRSLSPGLERYIKAPEPPR